MLLEASNPEPFGNNCGGLSALGEPGPSLVGQEESSKRSATRPEMN